MCDVMIATYFTGGKKENRKTYKILRMEKGSCLLKSTNATKFTEKKNVDIRPQVSAMHIRSCFKEIFSKFAKGGLSVNGLNLYIYMRLMNYEK